MAKRTLSRVNLMQDVEAGKIEGKNPLTGDLSWKTLEISHDNKKEKMCIEKGWFTDRGGRAYIDTNNKIIKVSCPVGTFLNLRYKNMQN